MKQFWRGRIRLMRVTGNSMLPTLAPGNLVLVLPRRPRPGDLVVALHPQTRQPIIKRLTAIESDGYWLEGDAHDPATAATSNDSWVFGAVPEDDVIGVAKRLF